MSGVLEINPVDYNHHFELKKGKVLIVDPCYISAVIANDRLRLDALKLIKELDVEGDGDYHVWAKRHKDDEKVHWLDGYFGDETCPVDSGRLWVFQAEIDCEVYLDVYEGGESVLSYVPYEMGVKNDDVEEF